MQHYAQKPKGLRRLAIVGSFYSLVSFGGERVFRLVGNLILSRLLFPEAFGIAATVYAFTNGLVMLSNVGIAASVIQSERGDDPVFLDVAWTMQIIRGATLLVVAAALAWPVGWFYDQPELGPLMAVSSISLIVDAFASPSLMRLRRHVEVRTAAFIQLACQLSGLALTIAVAWATGSVWALILGSIASAIVRVAISHHPKLGPRPHLRLDRDAMRAITTFGKWILFSSMATFLARQLDRLVLGKLLGMAMLGIYNIAITFADLGSGVVEALTRQILFPVLSRVHREDASKVKSVFYRARLALALAVLPAAGVLLVLAPRVIRFLYDARYVEAGWMLQVLIIRVVFTTFTTPAETCLYAIGNSRSGFIRSASKLAWLAVALPAGYSLFGVRGLLWAAALSELPSAVLLAVGLAKNGLLAPLRELVGPALFAGGYGVGTLVDMVL